MLKTRHSAFDRPLPSKHRSSTASTPFSAVARHVGFSRNIILQTKQTVQTTVHEDRFGSWLSKNATARDGDRTNVRPNRRKCANILK
jgi:hypothetical protein